MLVNLSESFTSEGEAKHYTLDIEMKQFQAPDGVYEIVSQESVSLKVTNMGNRTLVLRGEAGLSLMIPCNRCLEPVRNDFRLTIGRTPDMKLTGEKRLGDLDEQPYLKSYNLDVNQLVHDELLLNLPMKVLRDEDCEGIHNRCGANLDHEAYKCDRSSFDPGMLVIQDIFKQLKGVQPCLSVQGINLQKQEKINVELIGRRVLQAW